MNLEFSNQARSLYSQKRYNEAAQKFMKLFDENPSAWWLALEAYRSLIEDIKLNDNMHEVEFGNLIFFSPNYQKNLYQKNMYEISNKHNFLLYPLSKIQFSREFVREIVYSKLVIFHQHWLKEIYIKEKKLNEGYMAIDKYIGHLKALKCFGIKIYWTVHNLLDHDLTEIQRELCLYALGEMMSVSDVIHVHNFNAIPMLKELLKVDIEEDKFFVLEHPLYDNLLKIDCEIIPDEIKNKKINKNNKIILIAGMIRPYKGIEEFLLAIELRIDDFLNENVNIIIAGNMLDINVEKKIKILQEKYPNLFTIIPRFVSDEEMAYLLRISNLMVTPYRAILTSGSYYSSITFKVPVLAPTRGMFLDVIENNKTGFLYDGSVNDLAVKLYEICKMSDSELRAVGENAYNLKKDNTILNFSTKFFEKIGV